MKRINTLLVALILTGACKGDAKSSDTTAAGAASPAAAPAARIPDSAKVEELRKDRAAAAQRANQWQQAYDDSVSTVKGGGKWTKGPVSDSLRAAQVQLGKAEQAFANLMKGG